MKAQIVSAEPLFDSSRKALTFALNYTTTVPSPVMNRAMQTEQGNGITLADGSRLMGKQPSKGRPRDPQLKGLDGAAQAGLILQLLAALPHAQQLVLIASCQRPSNPCACRAPCCSGSRPNPPWANAVELLCDYLRDEAQLSRLPGKKGLSTAPHMRRALVEKHFIPSRELTLADLAKVSGVSEQTVIAHRKPISLFLVKQEDAAWKAIDESLSQAGIVGFLP